MQVYCGTIWTSVLLGLPCQKVNDAECVLQIQTPCETYKFSSQVDSHSSLTDVIKIFDRTVTSLSVHGLFYVFVDFSFLGCKAPDFESRISSIIDK